MAGFFTIKHRGVPVGTVELLPSGERVTVAVTPLPGYESIQQSVIAASRALSNVAIGAPTATPGQPLVASSNALGQAAQLGRSLELYDSSETLIPTDFIDLTEWPDGKPEIAAVIGLRESRARKEAPVVPPVSANYGSQRPRANGEL